MAELSEIRVDWVRRIVWYDWTDPDSVEVSVQDLIDTLAKRHEDWESGPWPMLYTEGEGKAPLGGGTYSGLILTLINAKLAFKGNTTAQEDGSVTTGNAAGTRLIDSSAQFVTKGVKEGAAAYNRTDGSIATVMEVISEIELETQPLDGGSDNKWDIGDDYQVFNVVVCTVSGGDFVSVDALGDEQDQIFPTPHTQVKVSASSSGTLVSEEGGLEDILELVDQIRAFLFANRLDLDESLGENMVVYKDDDQTPWIKIPVRNKAGGAITIPGGAPAIRPTKATIET